jgi:hypothetical protein
VIVDPLLSKEAVEFLTKEAEFVYAFYQAAELEVRATERYVLVGLGGMYSYLATRERSAPFSRLAWYAPTFVVLFAAIRALGLGLRQAELLQYLKSGEVKVLGCAGASAGWAHSFTAGLPIVATTAGVFYMLLVGLTFAIGWRMTHHQ